MKYIIGINFRVEGLEKLPKKEPYLILPNHQSFWENFFLQLILPTHNWVMKKELYNIPIFGWCVRAIGAIAVDRSNKQSVKQIIQHGSKCLQDGISLVIFPEATRVKPFRYVNLKPSAAKLAVLNQVPVVIIVHNAGLFWPKGFWVHRMGTITLRVAHVISAEEVKTFGGEEKANSGVRELNDEIQKIMHREKDIVEKLDLD